jgi:hypothetical protein
VGNGEYPVQLVIMLLFHVGRKIVALNDGVGLENDANEIVGGVPMGNNL